MSHNRSYGRDDSSSSSSYYGSSHSSSYYSSPSSSSSKDSYRPSSSSKDSYSSSKDPYPSRDSYSRDSYSGSRDSYGGSRDSYSKDSGRDSYSSKDSYSRDSYSGRDSSKGYGRDDYYSNSSYGSSYGQSIDMSDPYMKATFGNQNPDEMQTYSEKSVDVEDLFRKVNTGINFSKYNDIPVSCTGNNVPTPITNFDNSGLHDQVLDNVRKANYTTPTPVQKYAIPIGLAGRDLMACAQTGSGKTAAFLLPVLSKLMREPPPERQRGYKSYPLYIVLAPTRELAIQIHEEARKFAHRTPFRPCVVYGGAPFGAQAREVEYGCDILIATPGRLIDMIDRGKISLSRVKYLCMDEADRMLDMGFEKQIRSIVDEREMPGNKHRQTFMFSATFAKDVRQLAMDFLTDHIFLKVGRVGSTTESITQVLKYVRDGDKKDEILKDVKSVQGRTLIFTETKKDTDILARFLFSQGFTASAIHGDRSQREREAALNSFKQGRINILVATDVASRGLDISGVNHVINYDMPGNIDSYVHRIGRTGRAGHVGVATSYFNDDNKALAKKLAKVLTEANQTVPDFLQKMASDPFLNDKKNKGRFGGGNRFGGRSAPYNSRPYGGSYGSSQGGYSRPPGSYGAPAPSFGQGGGGAPSVPAWW